MGENVAYQLEGFLFPATYDLPENSNAKDVVATMLETFDGKISDEWTDYCEKNGMTLYELVTLASVVEKETLGDGVAQNIASVFINRLNIGQQTFKAMLLYFTVISFVKTDLAQVLLNRIILINARRFRAGLFVIRVLKI